MYVGTVRPIFYLASAEAEVTEVRDIFIKYIQRIVCRRADPALDHKHQ